MWRLFLAQRSTEPFSILKLPAKRSEQHLHPPKLLKEGRAPKISWGEGGEREKESKRKSWQERVKRWQARKKGGRKVEMKREHFQHNLRKRL